jgi:hypothetical protein
VKILESDADQARAVYESKQNYVVGSRKKRFVVERSFGYIEMKMKKDEGDVDRSVVWAAITSGEKYQDSNLPLLRIFNRSQMAGETRNQKIVMAGCNRILGRVSTGTGLYCPNYGCLSGSSVKVLPLTRVFSSASTVTSLPSRRQTWTWT